MTYNFTNVPLPFTTTERAFPDGDTITIHAVVGDHLIWSRGPKGRYCIAISAEHSDAFASLEQGISI